VPGIRNLLLQVKGDQGVVFDNQDLHRDSLDGASAPSGLAATDTIMSYQLPGCCYPFAIAG
jgi:hypothetical protein